jgi:hypothetical protein
MSIGLFKLPSISYVVRLIKQFKTRVTSDGGTFEAESCLKSSLTSLNSLAVLQQASLLVAPNAIKMAKLYSIIPSNGNGDFTFSRAGSATETMPNGLVEDVPYNLFQFSEEFSNGYWFKSAGTLTPNVTTAPDGTLTADLFTKTANINQTSNISRTSTTFYLGIVTISLYVKKNVGDLVGIRLVSGTQFNYNFTTGAFSDVQGTILAYGAENVGSGWIRLYLTANTSVAVNPFLLNMFAANLNDSVYVWGAQFDKGYIKPYVRTSDRTNIPRLDYTLGTCPLIEIEPSRTNLITFSEDMTQASVYTPSEVSISVNQIVAPDGNTTADKVIPSVVNGNHRIRLNTYGYNATASTVTVSVFAKKGELTKFRLGVSAAAAIGALFDLDNGTFTNISTGIGRITAYPNGWYRCSVTGTAGSVADTLLTDNSGNIAFAGNGTDGLFLWGWQFEQWPGAGLTTTSVFNATSYIPTYGTAVTRANEGLALSNLVANNIVSATGGTWFIHIVDNIPITREAATPIDRGLGISDTATVNFNGIAIRRSTSGTLRRSEITKSIGGVITQNIYTTSANEVKLVIKYSIGVVGSFDVFENGVKVVTASAFIGTLPLTYIGTRTSPSVSETPFINIKSMALFNTQLSDAECLALTTL